MCYVCANTSSTLRRVSGDNEEKSHQCGFTILSYSSQMPALFSCGFLTDVLLQFLYYYAELGHLGGSLSHIYNLLLGTTQLVLENPYLLGQDLKKCLSQFFNVFQHCEARNQNSYIFGKGDTLYYVLLLQTFFPNAAFGEFAKRKVLATAEVSNWVYLSILAAKMSILS